MGNVLDQTYYICYTSKRKERTFCSDRADSALWLSNYKAPGTFLVPYKWFGRTEYPDGPREVVPAVEVWSVADTDDVATWWYEQATANLKATSQRR